MAPAEAFFALFLPYIISMRQKSDAHSSRLRLFFAEERNAALHCRKAAPLCSDAVF